MKKNILKIILDVLMLVTVVLLYNRRVISMRFHEVGGLLLCAIFIIHLGFNLPWLKSIPAKIFKKSLPIKVKIGFVVNVLLLLCFSGICLSGIMISKTILTEISGNSMLWQPLHYFLAALTIILLGVHIGLHASFIGGMVGKMVRLQKWISTLLLTLFIIATISFGGYSIAKSSFSIWLALPFQFSSQSEEQHHDEIEEQPSDETEEQPSEEIHGQGKKSAQQSGKHFEKNGINILNIVSQGATFGSIILTISILTVGTEQLIKKKSCLT